jgi:ureidoacrylate peracid hydrolase
MHQVLIPQSVIDTVVARRGVEHVYSNLDPARTALIVVDLQNGFMMPGVAHALCETAVDIVPNVNRIARAVRETGGKVFWLKNTHDDSCLASWSHFHDDLTKPARRAKRIQSMSAGTLGHEIWADLEVEPEDEIVHKKRFSAFIQGSSDLQERLRTQGFDTLIITGTMTNVCCDSTARDAMMLNFRTIMVTDGNAASTDSEHNAALIAFYLTFGDIMDTEMLVGCLEHNASAVRIAA